MNRYDKIWVPSNSVTMDGGYKVIESSFTKSHLVAEVRPERDVIVLTIEEIREVWTMAKSSPDYPGVLELFLKSKGIALVL